MAEIEFQGRWLDDEFVGQIVIAAATALAETTSFEGSSTSDASLNALGANIATLAKSIVTNLGVRGNR